jgi:hypothetical protein
VKDERNIKVEEKNLLLSAKQSNNQTVNQSTNQQLFYTFDQVKPAEKLMKIGA